jgi:two-component system nitrate/nitrite sensor histidine kinase NarX
MRVDQDHSRKPDPGDQPYWQIFDAVGDGLIIQDVGTLRVVEANAAAAAMHGYGRDEFIGLHLTEYLHPDSLRHFTESVRAVQAGGVFEAAAIHVRHDGSPFHVEVRRTSFMYQSRPCLLSVVRDVSKRIRAEERLFQQAEARQREQAALLDVSHTLASTLELKPDLILDQLGAIVQYRHATLFVLQDSSLVAVAVRGVQPPEDEAPFRIRLDDPELLVQLFNEHRPIRIADLSSKRQPTSFMRTLLEQGAPMLLDGVRAWMWVPVAAKGRILGGIGIAQAERDFFSRHHADLALTVANQAAITMINAELYQNARSIAVVEERQRLARNLHDAVNQSLFSAGLIAEVLPRLWDRDQAQARRSLEDLRRLTRGAMAEMRALLAELRPATLTDADLGDLLRLLGNAFTGRTNVPVRVNVVGQGSLPAEVQVAIYRICQEALNNVAKHAGASTVDISLKQEAASIELNLRDDGRGFDPEAITSGHYGLGMMRERAEAVSALLSITSRPRSGTELTIRWKETAGKEVL